jgi:hypothetical protein
MLMRIIRIHPPPSIFFPLLFNHLPPPPQNLALSLQYCLHLPRNRQRNRQQKDLTSRELAFIVCGMFFNNPAPPPLGGNALAFYR